MKLKTFSLKIETLLEFLILWKFSNLTIVLKVNLPIILCSLLHLRAVCSYHVTHTFQRKSALYSCLNIKELLARNRRDFWSLSECNGTRTHNHLICKRTLNHLAKLAQWLSCVVSTYLNGAFDCMFLSCHVRVLE